MEKTWIKLEKSYHQIPMPLLKDKMTSIGYKKRIALGEFVYN
jgi:hypothetical protein